MLFDFIINLDTKKYSKLYYKGGKLVAVGEKHRKEVEFDLGNISFYIDNLKAIKEFFKRFVKTHGMPGQFSVVCDTLNDWVFVTFSASIETSTSVVCNDYVVICKKETFSKLLEEENV